jgi:hypothetical protein
MRRILCVRVKNGKLSSRPPENPRYEQAGAEGDREAEQWRAAGESSDALELRFDGRRRVYASPE